MVYRIELEKINGYKFESHIEWVQGVVEVKNFLKECVDENYKVVKIVKLFKDGRGTDVTRRYL